MSGEMANYLLKLVSRCFGELRKTCTKDRSLSICEHSSPLRLEELEQHGVSVEPLCNSLCNLEVGTDQEREGRLRLKKLT